MKSLIRTAVGGFRIEDALPLSKIDELMKAERLTDYVIPADAMFPHYDKLKVASEFDKLIYNGNAFTPEHLSTETSGSVTELVRVYDAENNFIGIYRYDTLDTIYKPVKMFI